MFRTSNGTRGARRPLAALIAAAVLWSSLGTSLGTGLAYAETQAIPAATSSLPADGPIMAVEYSPASGISYVAETLSVTAEAPSLSIPVILSSPEAASVGLQWQFGPLAAGQVTGATVEFLPVQNGGATEGTPVFSLALTFDSQSPVETPWYRLNLPGDQLYRLKVTANLADGVTAVDLPAAVTLVQQLAGEFNEAPISLESGARSLSALDGCVDQYVVYDGPARALDWRLTHRPGGDVENLSASLYRVNRYPDGSLDETQLAISDFVSPGQAWSSQRAAEQVALTPGLHRFATCGFHPTTETYTFTAAHSLESAASQAAGVTAIAGPKLALNGSSFLGNMIAATGDTAPSGPARMGPDTDLTEPQVFTNTFKRTAANPYESPRLPFYYTGAEPVQVEMELAIDPTATGGLSLYSNHRIADDSEGQTWVVDPDSPGLSLGTVPPGARYTTTGWILPGQNVIDLNLPLSDEATNEGTFPYSVTIRKVEPLPAEGRTFDLGAFAPTPTNITGGSWFYSRYRFTVAAPALYKVVAPTMWGHTDVSLRRISSQETLDTQEESFSAGLIAGEKVPFYLGAGLWELEVTHQAPNSKESPLPTDPGAKLAAIVQIGPWTPADGDPRTKPLTLRTSSRVNLKLPADWNGNYVAIATAPTGEAASLNQGWTSLQVGSGQTQSFNLFLQADSSFHWGSYTGHKDGYALTLLPVSLLGVEPVTLKGTISVDTPESAGSTSISLPGPGWYPIQVKTSAAKGRFNLDGASFPLHAAETEGSAPSAFLPGSSNMGLTLWPGDALKATWEITIGQSRTMPPRIITVQGELLPGEELTYTLPLGLNSAEHLGFHADLAGAAGSAATLVVNCGYSACANGTLFGTDAAETTEDDRSFTQQLPLTGSSWFTLKRADQEPSSLRYTVTVTLPPATEVLITQADGTGSTLVEGAGPLSLALGESLALQARDRGFGLNESGAVTGRTLHVTWSAAPSGDTPGEATIDRWGTLTATKPGEVTVTATYSDESNIPPATRVVTINGPTGPQTDLTAYAADTVGVWSLNGSASVPTPKRITSARLRLNGSGEWVNLPASAATLGQAWFSFYNLDPTTLFPSLATAEGTHQVELQVGDSAGGMTTVSTPVLVDHTPPVITAAEVVDGNPWDDVAEPSMPLPGSIPANRQVGLRAIGTDKVGASDGRLRSASFAWRPVGFTAWREIGQSSVDLDGNEYPATWNNRTYLPDGPYELRVIAHDQANNPSAPLIITVQSTGGAPDTNPPDSPTIGLNNGTYSQFEGKIYPFLPETAEFQIYSWDRESGLAKAKLRYRPATGKDEQGQQTWGDWVDASEWIEWNVENGKLSFSPAAKGLAGGLYQWQAVVADLAGNQREGTAASYRGLLEAVVPSGPITDPTSVTASFLPPDTESGQGARVRIEWSAVNGATRYLVERQNPTAPDTWDWVGQGWPGSDLYLFDLNMPQGSELVYRVVVVDGQDTRSPGLVTTRVSVESDQEKPVVGPTIVSGSRSGTVRGSATLIIPYSDNQGIQSIAVGAPISSVQTPANRLKGELTASWDTRGVKDGSYTISVTATDLWGNQATESVSVIVDNIGPEPPASGSATALDGKIQVDVTWTPSPSEDVEQYRVYQIQGAAQKLLAALPASALGYTDLNVLPGNKYRYAIQAVDKAGNASITNRETNEVLVGEDHEFPVIRLSSSRLTQKLSGEPPTATVSLDAKFSTDNVGIVSWSWDPGDGSFETTGSSSFTHTYTKAGSYTLTLSVSDRAGNETQGIVPIEIIDPSSPSLTVQVRRSGSETVIPNVSLVTDIGTFTTDASGEAVLVGNPGPLTVNLIAEGYVGSTQVVTLPEKGEERTILYLKPGQLAVGTITQRRLTLDEIKAAGIDITNPANTWVEKLEIEIKVEPDADNDGDGNADCPTGSCTVTIFTDNDDKVYRSGGGAPGVCTPANCKVQVVSNPSNPSEKSLIIFKIDGEARWLKEFFRIDALIVNPNPEAFVLRPGQLRLTADGLGSGLALVPAPGLENSSTSAAVEVPELPGQKSYKATWVVRGDQPGTYAVTATYRTTVAVGDVTKPVEIDLKTDEPIRVYGKDAIKTTFDWTPKEPKEGDLVEITVKMENTSPVPVYMLSLTMREPHLLEQGEAATKELETLPGKETWTTKWRLQVPSDDPPPVPKWFGQDEEPELDPPKNPTHLIRGRAVYDSGDLVMRPAVGAYVSVNGRVVATTDSDGNFEAPTDAQGTVKVKVFGGGWYGAWNKSVTLGDTKIVPIGTGYLISSTTGTALENRLAALEATGVHSASNLDALRQYAQSVLEKGKEEGSTESVGERDENRLRRLHEAVNIMTMNHSQVDDYLETASEGIWLGAMGPIEALVTYIDLGGKVAEAIRMIPVIGKPIGDWIQNAVKKHLGKQLKQVQAWVQRNVSQQARRLFEAKAKAEINQLIADIEESVNKGVEARMEGLRGQEDGARARFNESIKKIYRIQADADLLLLVQKAKASSVDGSFSPFISANIGRVRSLNKQLYLNLTAKRTRMAAVNDFLANTLSGTGEQAGNVSDFLSLVKADRFPPLAAVSKAVEALGALATTGNLITQMIGIAPANIAGAFDTIYMVTGPQGLNHLNQVAGDAVFTANYQPPVSLNYRPFYMPRIGDNWLAQVTATLRNAAARMKPPGRLGGFGIFGRSPIDIYVEDENGFALGIDPTTRKPVPPERQIPGGFYSGPDTEPEYVLLPETTGKVKVIIVGTGDGEATLEFTRSGFAALPDGSAETAEDRLVLHQMVKGGSSQTFDITIPDVPAEGTSDRSAPALPQMTRDGALLPTLTLDGSGTGKPLGAVAGQPLSVKVNLANGAALQQVELNIPWDPTLLGSSPTILPAAGFELTTAPTPEALAAGDLTAVLTRTAPATGTGTEELFQIQTTPTATGQAILRLSSPEVKLFEKAGQPGDDRTPALHLGGEASLVVTDGKVTVEGNVSVLFGDGLGYSVYGEGAPVLTVAEARSTRLGRLEAAQAEPLPGASVKVWQVSPAGEKLTAEPHYAAETGPDGSFRIEGMEPGSYLAEVSAPGMALRQQRLTVGLTDSRLGLFDLLPGDVNADGTLDLLDFVLMQRNLGSLANVADSALRARLAWADLNRDGELTAAEVLQLRPFLDRSSTEQ